MTFNTLVRIIVALFVLAIIAGCKPQSSPSPKEEPVKTAAEYKAEADKEVTEANMDQELDSIEKSIDAEAADANQTP